MRLNSARDLKAEIFAQPMGTGAALRSLTLEVGMTRRAAGVSATVGGEFAMGIKGKRKNYKLAIRVQKPTPGLGMLIESIRKRCKGEVEVRNIGTVHKQQWHRRRNRPLRIGGSLGPANRDFGGTLGCFVTSRGSGADDARILSNNHVLADENRLRLGTNIVQPARLDNGHPTRDVVGSLAKFVRLKRRVNRVDAAIADVIEGISYYYNWLEGLGSITGVRTTPLEDGEIVYKVGRTTGMTKGRVSAIEMDRVFVEYDLGELRFDDQIEIEPVGTRPFSLGGDSGSLIVDRQRRAIALLFAGNDVDATFANPIAAVLDALRVNLLY